MKKIQLWGTKVSPFVRKVVNVLDYKGLDYEIEEVLPKVLAEATKQEVSSGFLQASPLGKIPALSIGQTSFSDSSVIAAVLDRLYPEKSIYPSAPELYGKALWLEKYADTKMTDVAYKIFLEKVVKPFVLGVQADSQLIDKIVSEELPPVLAYLDSNLDQAEGGWLVAEEPTVADFAVVNHLIGLDAAGISWKDGRFARLESYFKKALEAPFIARGIPEVLKS